jgi:hypothetical protein
MSSTRPVGYQRLGDLLIGARVAMALRVAAEHRIADLLAGGPNPVDTLSAETGLPAPTLRRLMRALSASGVFDETTDDWYANTDVSNFMRSDVSPSVREGILVLNDAAVLKGWMQLPVVRQSGSPAFPAVKACRSFSIWRPMRREARTWPSS